MVKEISTKQSKDGNRKQEIKQENFEGQFRMSTSQGAEVPERDNREQSGKEIIK